MIASLLLAAVVGTAPASADLVARDVPEGVVIDSGAPSANAHAAAVLARVLADHTPETLAAQFATADSGGRPGLLLGTFASRELLDTPGFDAGRVVPGNGQVAFAPDVPINYSLVGARTPEQRAYLAAAMRAKLPEGAPTTIRAPDFDELALVWYFIGWDLDGPLLVAEWGPQRYFFDFDVAGDRITWVERLSEPCFRLGQSDKTLLRCHCFVFARDGQHWSPQFEPKGSTCPN
jgi:hypothetical protein